VEPRTTVISDDGRSLYVVDYHPGTVVKLATSDLSELQERYLGYHPIGVTYDDASDKIWVAGYGGSVWVLKDR
jgi:DNA-binding beta-propeller fold protein YncE